jgi:hypothetical protein
MEAGLVEEGKLVGADSAVTTAVPTLLYLIVKPLPRLAHTFLHLVMLLLRPAGRETIV